MADVPAYATGDTWPPLSGTVRDDEGITVPIAGASSLRFIAKSGSTVIAGAAVNLDDGVTPELAGTWEYRWGAADTSVAGDYIGELEVKWDAVSTPQKIETFPPRTVDKPHFTIDPDLD
jgi:hypothetical protein